MPIVKVDGKWIDLGGYTKYGLSASDPKFGLTFGLSYKFKIPRQWIALAERQLTKRGRK